MKAADADPPARSVYRSPATPVQDNRPVWLAQLYEWRSAFLFGLLILAVLIGGIWWGVSYNQRTREDVAGTPLQYGSAQVANRLFSHAIGRYREKPPSATLQFWIGKRLVTYQTRDVAKAEQTRVGETVEVSYRVGKSGDIYIEDWQPPVVKAQVPVSRGGN